MAIAAGKKGDPTARVSERPRQKEELGLKNSLDRSRCAMQPCVACLFCIRLTKKVRRGLPASSKRSWPVTSAPWPWYGSSQQGVRKRKAAADANAETAKVEKERDELREALNILEAQLGTGT